MIGGIGYPRRMAGAVVGVSTGAYSADYPVQNVLNLAEPRRVALCTSAGERDIVIHLPENRPVQMISLVHHNIPEGVTVGTALFSSLPVDSGSNPGGLTGALNVTVPARVPGLPQILPMIFGVSASTRGVFIRIPDFGSPLEIGAVDVSSWWEWPDITVDEERGFAPSTISTDQPGGTIETTRQWAPRIQTGNRAVGTSADVEAVQDFQMLTGRSKPFVFVRDKTDPTRWSREAFVARNNVLPGVQVGQRGEGAMAFNLIEHLG